MHSTASTGIAQAATPCASDINLASSYLTALAKPGTPLAFQTFDDSSAKRRDLVRMFHTHDFARIADQMVTLNRAGAGVFVTVNETDGKGRAADNIVKVRAVFVDADDVPRPARWHVEPDFITWRDDRHWHAYWLVLDMPLDGFSAAQKRLAAFYNADPKVCDLPRVMRVPGFLHQKGAPTPVLFQRLRQCSPRSAGDVLAGLPEARTNPRTTPVGSDLVEAADAIRFERWSARVAADAIVGNRNNTLFQIACEGCGRGLPQQIVQEICRQHANGLDEKELASVVSSAFAKPRVAHPRPRVLTFMFPATPAPRSPKEKELCATATPTTTARGRRLCLR
jgi:hypothetical protein